MNICMVVHAYYPHDETRVQREADALIKKGYGVDVICLRKGKEPLSGCHNGVSFYRLPVSRHSGKGTMHCALTYLLEYSSFFFLTFLKLTILYFKRNYKIIQFHNPPDALVFAGLIPRILGASIILDIHDPMPELYAVKFNKVMNHRLIQILLFTEHISCKFADYVLTVNEICRKRLIDRAVEDKKCGVVMNLPDESFKPIGSIDPKVNSLGGSFGGFARRAKGLRFELIYHGTLVERYGVDIAILAVNLLKDKIPEIRLNIIGEGEELDRLLKLAESLHLGQGVYFNEKFVPAEELPEIITQMDLGVVPNRSNCFTDMVLNVKLLEYVAMQIPVVASRTQGIEHYFDDSMMMFFNPEDVEDLASKILWLYNNSKNRKELVNNAKRFLDKYNWIKEKEKYCSIIENFKNGRGILRKWEV